MKPKGFIHGRLRAIRSQMDNFDSINGNAHSFQILKMVQTFLFVTVQCAVSIDCSLSHSFKKRFF
jgi:hypothetical protein